MSAVSCVACGRELADGFACSPCALSLSQTLKIAAGHAEDAEAVIARQVRYTAGGSGGSEEPMPVDLAAATRFGAVENTFGTWARDLSESTGEPIPPPVWPQLNVAAIAAAFLARHVDLIRTGPAAAEAFDELHDACEQLARLVDRPPDKQLVGVCDCGKVLYAAAGRTVVQCPERTCKLVWNVEESREILRKHLGDKLVTVSEAARLLAYLDSDRTQDNLRKLIGARLGRLAAHGLVEGEPTYLFREVTALVAAIPKRERRDRETAEMGA